MVEKLRSAACKLHIEDLKEVRSNDGSSANWLYDDGFYKFSFDLVWMQSAVSFVSASKHKIELNHCGVTVSVTQCDEIPGGNVWLKSGLYVMVIGTVIDIKSSMATVNAIKIVDLSGDRILQDMWPMEIEESKKLLTQINN